MSAGATLAALTPRSKHIDGAGFGGMPKLTVSDIAAGLAGLGETETLLLRAKYLGDRSSRSKLERELATTAVVMAQKSKAREIDWNRGFGIARIVMAYCVDASRCTDCRGTGYTPTSNLNPVIRGCTTCGGQGERGGDGVFRMNESEESFLSGIPLSTYRDTWRDVTKEIIRDMYERESSALDSIKRKLWGE